MRKESNKKQSLRQKRAWRVRKHIRGTAERPRLSVHKSNQHIQAQLIDDESGVTLGSIATFNKEFRGTEFSRKNKVSAQKLGHCIADIAKSRQIEEVVFDRGASKYHGTLRELAEAARANGLKF